MQKVIIIGAGIVGLATGYQLLKARPDLKVIILEKEAEPAKHQTGNNSGVIHSGVYYKPGSLKAKNCTAGKEELLQFCSQFGIPTQKLGKVIVASQKDQLPRLDEIESRGKANGVKLERIGPSRLKEIEPQVQALEALWIPECSIISYKQVAKHLASEIQRMGGEIHFGESAEEIRQENDHILLLTSKNTYQATSLINCAGLFSDRIARKILGRKVTHRILPFRGEYYELDSTKQHLVKGLIYPVPDPRFPFLGVHLTRMIDGKVEAGPNAILAMAREGYKKTDINFRDCLDTFTYPGFWKMALKYWQAGLYEMARSFSKKLFLRDLQQLVPSIEERDLSPGGAGIRAQVVTREGKLVDDFSILEEKRMVHVLNAPSPAATASFAIGRYVAERALSQM
jgi:L-2-hydroxyglutarate oxidase